MNSSVNLFEYKKIGTKILQRYEIERKIASMLLMQKFESKECRGFVQKTYVSCRIYHSINICIYFV